jgi:hypothetical protein
MVRVDPVGSEERHRIDPGSEGEPGPVIPDVDWW